MLPLKFDRWNLFIWRHLEISSDLLLRSVLLSAFIISSFSFRQRLHRLDSLLYGCAFLIIDQLMENGLFFLFNCQICFDSSVVFSCFSWLKDWSLIVEESIRFNQSSEAVQ